MQSANSQMIESSTVDTMTFNTVILRRANSEVLLVRSGCQLELPIVIIPKWRRVAQEVTEFILRMWGLKTVCLFQPAAQGGDSDDAQYFVVLEARDSSSESLPPAGWFDALAAWAQKQVDPHGLKLTGKFCQLNGSPSFSLVRLETNGPSIWFKAVGEPNRHEFPITVMLARRFPRYLPTLIATEPSWNGWLTFEVEGAMLDENSDISTWEKAGGALAELQMESVTQACSL